MRTPGGCCNRKSLNRINVCSKKKTHTHFDAPVLELLSACVISLLRRAKGWRFRVMPSADWQPAIKLGRISQQGLNDKFYTSGRFVKGNLLPGKLLRG